MTFFISTVVILKPSHYTLSVTERGSTVGVEDVMRQYVGKLTTKFVCSN